MQASPRTAHGACMVTHGTGHTSLSVDRGALTASATATSLASTEPVHANPSQQHAACLRVPCLTWLLLAAWLQSHHPLVTASPFRPIDPHATRPPKPYHNCRKDKAKLSFMCMVCALVGALGWLLFTACSLRKTIKHQSAAAADSQQSGLASCTYHHHLGHMMRAHPLPVQLVCQTRACQSQCVQHST